MIEDETSELYLSNHLKLKPLHAGSPSFDDIQT